jgi:hypothetical protein
VNQCIFGEKNLLLPEREGDNMKLSEDAISTIYDIVKDCMYLEGDYTGPSSLDLWTELKKLNLVFKKNDSSQSELDIEQ